MFYFEGKYIWWWTNVNVLFLWDREYYGCKQGVDSLVLMPVYRRMYIIVVLNIAQSGRMENLTT